jgi:hypothetical protein
MEDVLTRIMMYFMAAIAIAIWAVIGFVFWVPLLARATTVFALALLPAAFSDEDISEKLTEGLERAAVFYFHGFGAAIRAVRGDNRGGGHDTSVGRIIVESIWVIVFWLILLYVTRPAVATLLSAWWRTLVK